MKICMYWKLASLSFHQTFFDNSYCNINIGHLFKLFLTFIYSKQRSQFSYLILHVSQFLIIMSVFIFNIMNCFSKIINEI